MKHQNMKVLFEGWRRFINENEKKTLIENKNFIDYIDKIAQDMINKIDAELANRKKASVDGGFDDDLFIEKVSQLRSQALTSIIRTCKESGVDVNLCKDEFNQRLKTKLLNLPKPEEFAEVMSI